MTGGSVVVVGASMGGLRAAEQLRTAGWTGSVTVVGDEPHMPYNRPPLSKEVLAGKASFDSLAFTPKASTADVEWRLRGGRHRRGPRCRRGDRRRPAAAAHGGAAR